MASILQAIRYSHGKLAIIDQLQLPYVEKFITIRTSEDAWHAIKEMRVRGAPAIAIVAALALASELNTLIIHDKLSSRAEEVKLFIREKLDYLVSSRPTAVNLSDAARKLESTISGHADTPGATGRTVAEAFIRAAEEMMTKDLDDNMKIGQNGAEWIIKHALARHKSTATVLTHCNTGSLATSGYGTALGVIRSLASKKALEHAYCTETRPYNQGSRLTAFELVHDRLPATLITDSMVAALLASTKAEVDAIVVGADRVAANGDTANKIGTYGLAVLAKYHGVKFLVAAPLTTIDLGTKSGEDIVIEERPSAEVTKIRGPVDGDHPADIVKLETVHIAAKGIDVWNPAFDVTPSTLIDGIITEKLVQLGFQVCQMVFEYFSCFFTPYRVTRSHKLNGRDHSGLSDGMAASHEHIPRYFAKSGPIDADPKKTKKDGGGKGNWGRSGEEVQDYDYTFTNARRHSNSSSQGMADFRTKFETIEPDPVFEHRLHGPQNDSIEQGDSMIPDRNESGQTNTNNI
ncbi:hypothetical protein V8F44DRAFT_635298 [Aspergillus fumigatus]